MPLFARISFVADAYDVMTTGRIYRAVQIQLRTSEVASCLGRPEKRQGVPWQ